LFLRLIVFDVLLDLVYSFFR